MWKWMYKAGRLVATALLLSFLSVWTTGYIVNSYIETVLKQLDLPLQVQPPGLSGFWGNLWGADQRNTGELGLKLHDSPEIYQREKDAPGDRKPMTHSETPEDVPVFGSTESAREITEDEREKLRNVLIQLNEEQLLHLSHMMENGWTQSELEAAAKLFEQTLNEEDYNILMEILSGTNLLQEDQLHPAQDQAF